MPSLSELQTSQPAAVQQLRQTRQHQRLHQAYILSGCAAAPHSALAEALCTALVCQHPTPLGDGCEQCAACRKLRGHNHPDLLVLQPNDKGTIPTDAVREVTARLGLRSAESPVKLVRIDNADAMGPAAQNALLKTLEEPPGNTLFLLLTTRLGALLPTIRSRCLTVRLAPAPAEGWEGLAVDEPLKTMLLAASAGDVALAHTWVDADGIAGIWTTLQGVLPPHTEITQVLQVAAELGADRKRTDLALMLLEVWLRDSLSASAHPPGVAGAVDALQQARRSAMLHLNRAMLLENILLVLGGAQLP